MWSLLVWAAFGFIAAIIAKAIVPGKDPGGFFVTILIGIGGAILGGKISSLFGIDMGGKVQFYDPRDWIFSVLGAVIILYVWKKIIAPRLSK